MFLKYDGNHHKHSSCLLDHTRTQNPPVPSRFVYSKFLPHAKYYKWPAHGRVGTALDPESTRCHSSCRTRACPHQCLPARYKIYPSPRHVTSASQSTQCFGIFGLLTASRVFSPVSESTAYSAIKACFFKILSGRCAKTVLHGSAHKNTLNRSLRGPEVLTWPCM